MGANSTNTPDAGGSQIERPVVPPGPKRGIVNPEETRQCETRAGTRYEIAQWTCPMCSQPRSTLYIDDEWCHGESYHIAFGKGPNGDPAEQCGTCWHAEIDAMPHNQERHNVMPTTPNTTKAPT